MMKSPLLIREYDPTWPDCFAVLAARVQPALGNLVLRIEHIGGTAVPGLAANPVVDLDVVVSRADAPEVIRRLAGLGCTQRPALRSCGSLVAWVLTCFRLRG